MVTLILFASSHVAERKQEELKAEGKHSITNRQREQRTLLSLHLVTCDAY
jgi:hypothetical protein